jgi:hypothetical protein
MNQAIFHRVFDELVLSEADQASADSTEPENTLCIGSQ